MRAARAEPLEPYYEPAGETAENLRLMRLIDEQYTARPFYGSRRMTAWLTEPGGGGEPQAGAAADAGDGPGGDLPQAAAESAREGHTIYPYLLRGVTVERVTRSGAPTSPTCRMASGFMYLAAVIDWFSRYVIAWRLSNTLDGSFCLEMLEEALRRGQPEVFNTDQGVQFTAGVHRAAGAAGVAVSMDGRGRALDNVFVERLWRSVKYEDIYMRGYETVRDCTRGLARYFGFYNDERLHQSLGYRTPAAVYRE